MAEDSMTAAAAVGVLRRGRQLLDFLDKLETAARVAMRSEESMGGVQQALQDKQRALAQAERDLAAQHAQHESALAAMSQAFTDARAEHMAQMATLDEELDKKRQDVQTAKANEDADYMQGATAHAARLEALKAEISEREGYLAQLNTRIGQLRADMDLVRGA